MARITFVYPDFESLGIEYLMAVCLRDGHAIDLVPYNAEDPYVCRKEDHIPFASIARDIADTSPDMVAFSCVTANYRHQLHCARALKEIMPEVLTVFGGIHPTALPGRVLREGAVDCVAVGEAENSFLNFIRACNFSNRKHLLPTRPIQGIVFKEKDRFAGEFREGQLADLDSLPVPCKEPFYSRLKSFSREYYIMSSRGCPYSCSYCFNSRMHELRTRHAVRRRTIGNVLEEIARAQKNYSPEYIYFVDDCFTSNAKWILEFCRQYRTQIGLPFGCIAIPQFLNEEVIEALRFAGCWCIQIGVQCLDQQLCAHVLKRHHDRENIAQVITSIKKAGIVVHVDHMLGIPGDTAEIEEDGALFYNQYRPNKISVFWLTYYPGTTIVGTAKEEGLLDEHDIEAINEGCLPAQASIHSGGSSKNPRPYYAINLLFNYLPLLPKWLVSWLVKTRWYKIFAIRNNFMALLLPRFLIAVLNRKMFSDRMLIRRCVDKLFSTRRMKKDDTETLRAGGRRQSTER